MILILEIMLTAAAWRRGWRVLALVPISIAFITGLLIGSSGVETLGFWTPLIEAPIVIVLAVMAVTTGVAAIGVVIFFAWAISSFGSNK